MTPAKYGVVLKPELLPSQWKGRDSLSFTALTFLDSDSVSNILIIQFSPFKVELVREGVTTIEINGRNLMHYEQDGSAAQIADAVKANSNRDVDRHKGKTVVDYGEDGNTMRTSG